MSVELKNSKQIKDYLVPIICDVVEDIMNKILDLNYELIQQIVYSAYFPNVYERTEEFAFAWDYSSPQISGNHISSSFNYNPDTMSYVPELAQHGSPFGANDVREYLAEIIYEGLSGPLFGDGPWREKRNAWEELLKVVGKQKMNQWIREGFRNRGINITQIYKRKF